MRNYEMRRYQKDTDTDRVNADLRINFTINGQSAMDNWNWNWNWNRTHALFSSKLETDHCSLNGLPYHFEKVSVGMKNFT